MTAGSSPSRCSTPTSTRRSRDTRSTTGRRSSLRVLRDDQTPEVIVAAFLDARYTNTQTRLRYGKELRLLFRTANVQHPGHLTDAALLAWIMAPASNNYCRDRLSLARVFLRWAHKQNPAVPLLDDDLARHIRDSKPRVYGKKQAPYPARFLTADEAQHLLDACQDGTWAGSRDQLALRFGLLGIRVQEIVDLRWANLHPDGTLHWMGKRSRPRSATPGPKLTDMLARWQRRQAQGLGRPVRPTDPIVCRLNAHSTPMWGRTLSTQGYGLMLLRRAAIADLGHIAPHDLRRSCAAILHRAKSADGGHLYDLLDIQQVLDHADPATTQRSYLDQIDNATKQNAGRTLDL